MAKTHPDTSVLLREALSVDTSVDHLQDLYRADRSLGPAIASNPSAPWKLLNRLALKHPVQVLANPLLKLRGLETDSVWKQFKLASLVSLCLFSEQPQHQDLVKATGQRLFTGMQRLEGEHKGSISSVWVHRRDFTLRPDDCNQLIPVPLSFSLEVRTGMEGEGLICVGDLPCADFVEPLPDCSSRDALVAFLEALRSEKICDYIDDSDVAREDCCEDYVLRCSNLPREMALEDLSLCRHDDELFQFSWNYGGASEPLEFEEGFVTVPLEFVDEADLRYRINMGELRGLMGLVPEDNGSAVLDWPTRLVSILYP